MNTKMKLANIAFPVVVALASIVVGTLLVAFCCRLALPFELSVVVGYFLSTALAIIIISSTTRDELKTTLFEKWE